MEVAAARARLKAPRQVCEGQETTTHPFTGSVAGETEPRFHGEDGA